MTPIGLEDRAAFINSVLKGQSSRIDGASKRIGEHEQCLVDFYRCDRRIVRVEHDLSLWGARCFVLIADDAHYLRGQHNVTGYLAGLPPLPDTETDGWVTLFTSRREHG